MAVRPHSAAAPGGSSGLRSALRSERTCTRGGGCQFEPPRPPGVAPVLKRRLAAAAAAGRPCAASWLAAGARESRSARTVCRSAWQARRMLRARAGSRCRAAERHEQGTEEPGEPVCAAEQLKSQNFSGSSQLARSPAGCDPQAVTLRTCSLRLPRFKRVRRLRAPPHPRRSPAGASRPSDLCRGSRDPRARSALHVPRPRSQPWWDVEIVGARQAGCRHPARAG